MLTSYLVALVGKRAGVALAALLPYVLGLVLLVVGGWLFYNRAYDHGVQDTEIKYQLIIAKEQKRLKQANVEALAEAEKRQRAYEVLLGERDDKISKLLEEAKADPNAGRAAIGSDSVRRLNSIR